MFMETRAQDTPFFCGQDEGGATVFVDMIDIEFESFKRSNELLEASIVALHCTVHERRVSCTAAVT